MTFAENNKSLGKSSKRGDKATLSKCSKLNTRYVKKSSAAVSGRTSLVSSFWSTFSQADLTSLQRVSSNVKERKIEAAHRVERIQHWQTSVVEPEELAHSSSTCSAAIASDAKERQTSQVEKSLGTGQTLRDFEHRADLRGPSCLGTSHAARKVSCSFQDLVSEPGA